MHYRIALLPALLSLALAGSVAPSAAAVLPKPLAVTHAAFTPMHVEPALVTSETLPLADRGWPEPATTPSVVGSYIAAVLAITGVPCFDCVNGKTKGTFGSGYPLGYVNTNVLYMGILMEWFDVSDTGKCTLSIDLTLGTKTLKSASASFTPTKGSVENTLMNVTRSSTWHGAASMTGKVVCGATTFTQKGFFYFE
jgi:hypothetical protein